MVCHPAWVLGHRAAGDRHAGPTNNSQPSLQRLIGNSMAEIIDCGLFGCCSKALNSLFTGDNLEKKVDKLNMANVNEEKGVD